MKSDLPKSFKEGDELTASLVNDILQELWRWRRMEGMPPLHVSETDSDAPPVISFFQQSGGQIFAGTTGNGFNGGSPASPKQVTLTSLGTVGCDIYMTETSTGWANPTNVINAYNIYTLAIVGNKYAYYWKSPDTGNYYIITADC